MSYGGVLEPGCKNTQAGSLTCLNFVLWRIFARKKAEKGQHRKTILRRTQVCWSTSRFFLLPCCCFIFLDSCLSSFLLVESHFFSGSCFRALFGVSWTRSRRGWVSLGSGSAVGLRLHFHCLAARRPPAPGGQIVKCQCVINTRFPARAFPNKRYILRNLNVVSPSIM